MKKIVLSLVVFVLAGCSPSAEEVAFPIVPEGLKDCTFYHMSAGGIDREITVARCPNSTTSTNYIEREGKHEVTKTAILIDGVEYVKK